jgi:hypothetical protein
VTVKIDVHNSAAVHQTAISKSEEPRLVGTTLRGLEDWTRVQQFVQHSGASAARATLPSMHFGAQKDTSLLLLPRYLTNLKTARATRPVRSHVS